MGSFFFKRWSVMLVALTISGCCYVLVLHADTESKLDTVMQKDTSELEIAQTKPPSLPRHLSTFRKKMTPREKDRLVHLFEEVGRLFQSNNISFHLQWGTLLGAYRHGGVVPWDDDIDIAVNVLDRPFIQKIFQDRIKSSMWQSICYVKYDDYVSRIYYIPGNSRNNSHGCFDRWPFVDISFYSIHADGIEYRPMCNSVICPPKRLKMNRIFPLQIIKFEDRFHYAPRDIGYVIGATYKADLLKQCCNHKSHMNLTGTFKSVCINCSELRPYYRFVK